MRKFWLSEKEEEGQGRGSHGGWTGAQGVSSKVLFPGLPANLLCASGPVTPTGTLFVSLNMNVKWGQISALCNLGDCRTPERYLGQHKKTPIYFDNSLKQPQRYLAKGFHTFPFHPQRG